MKQGKGQQSFAKRTHWSQQTPSSNNTREVFTSPDGHTKIILIIFFVAKDGESLYSQQKQDYELTVAQIKTPKCSINSDKLKKVRKTTRPFRYDLNHIRYDYILEERNRFKGLDLIDRVPDELWAEVCDIVQEMWIKTNPKKRNAKEQNGYLRRPYK